MSNLQKASESLYTLTPEKSLTRCDADIWIVIMVFGGFPAGHRHVFQIRATNKQFKLQCKTNKNAFSFSKTVVFETTVFAFFFRTTGLDA